MRYHDSIINEFLKADGSFDGTRFCRKFVHFPQMLKLYFHLYRREQFLFQWMNTLRSDSTKRRDWKQLDLSRKATQDIRKTLCRYEKHFHLSNHENIDFWSSESTPDVERFVKDLKTLRLIYASLSLCTHL